MTNIKMTFGCLGYGAHVKRARFHAGMLDSKMLKESQDFGQLRDSYVIFIYRNDKFGKGLPVYHIERQVQETGELFGDGSHIVYVNGKYTGDDSIGQLISDFNQKNPDDIHYVELAEGVRHYKETKQGSEIMCESVEKYGDRRATEAAKEATEKAAEKAMRERIDSIKCIMENLKLSLDQALNAMGITGDERTSIIQQLTETHE